MEPEIELKADPADYLFTEATVIEEAAQSITLAQLYDEVRYMALT